jgi:anti-sigma factor RsiW
MRHSSDEELVLQYYGEGAAEVREHVDVCKECSERLQALRRDLDSIPDSGAPEPTAMFEQEVWNALRPQLRLARASKPVRRMWPRYVAAAAAAAVLVVLSFTAGRWSTVKAPLVAEDGRAVRERVLIIAVGEHLERSQMVLAEIVNAEPGEKLTGERAIAQSLVLPNRMYRQTAAMAGDAETASLLEDIERVLLEVAHSPDEGRGRSVERLRQRIEQQGLLFRIRVTESQMQGKMGVL